MEDFTAWPTNVAMLQEDLKQSSSSGQFTAMNEDTSSTLSQPASNKSSGAFNLANINKLPWKKNLQHSVNFDLVAPGLITLLGFDGIELWALDQKIGEVVMLADCVRDETLLEWSKHSNLHKFSLGKGMVGRVFLSGESEWQSDVGKIQPEIFHRSQAARRLGVRGVGCVRCVTVMGIEVVVFLYSRRDLTFNKDRIAFVEGMISQWIKSGKDSTKFYSTNTTSSKRSSMQMQLADSGNTTQSSAMEAEYERNQRPEEANQAQSRSTNDQGNAQDPMMRLMVLDFFLSSFGAITKHLRFDGSEIWIEDSPGSGVLHHGGTIATKPLHKEWASYSTHFKFSNERSLIGRILCTTRPEWQPDVSQLSISVFTRATGARRYGVRGMCGVYCRTRKGLQFVIALFSGNRVTFTKERKRSVLKMMEIWAQGSFPGPTKPIKIISRGGTVLTPESSRTNSPVFPQAHSLNSWVDMHSAPLQGMIESHNSNSIPVKRLMEGGYPLQSSSSVYSTGSASSMGSSKRGKSKCRYVCGYCEKIFHKKGNWQAHLRTHTKEKPFACSACGRQFTQKSNMKRHMLKIHKIPKDFPSRGNLRQSASMPGLQEFKDKPQPNFFAQDVGPSPHMKPQNPMVMSGSMTSNIPSHQMPSSFNPNSMFSTQLQQHQHQRQQQDQQRQQNSVYSWMRSST
mmetsp:Transcript_9575/g.13378  ORF Transcript_9575/g.13378 Transcript_9575/m.13378 type:complete len:681 (-) Transcript_9575:653-2695(-)